jgi:hypothetical protein
MSVRLNAIAIPFITLLLIVGTLSVVAYATRASAEPATSTEYAEYRNDRWHYSLAMPADMKVSEHEREGGGHTVQFMDAAGDKELIISAWPYTQLDLTLGRIGEPSNSADQPDHFEIVDVMRDDLFTVCSRRTVSGTASSRFPSTKPGSPTFSPPGNSPTSDPATPPALHSSPPPQHRS